MKDTRQWIARSVSLILIVLIGCLYQAQAKEWQNAKEERDAEILEVEAYNRGVEEELERREQEKQALEAQMQEADESVSVEPEEKRQYTDGSYEGTGEGFGGSISVKVVIESDEIQTIEVLSAESEDALYFSAAEQLIADIIWYQDTDVDVVTGATLSSKGIISAVENALDKARVK